jgi:hypothetical protein
MRMLRYLLACFLLLTGWPEANAQATQPRTYRKLPAYSIRKARPKRAATTGKVRPTGTTVRSQGSSDHLYLAPGLPMHKQLGYAHMGSYSGRETLPRRPAAKVPVTKQPANTSLSSGTKPATSKVKAKAPADSKTKVKTKPKKARRWKLFG